METKTLFIVWTTDDQVHGIYKDKTRAINEYEKIQCSDNESKKKVPINWLKLAHISEYSTIGAAADPGIIRIKNKARNSMFLTTVNESGGGGSYRNTNYSHLSFSMQSGIAFALDFFDNEHARPEIQEEDNCPECTGKKNKNKKSKEQKCKQKFISDLKKIWWPRLNIYADLIVSVSQL